jgi:hypothetical protein
MSYLLPRTRHDIRTALQFLTSHTGQPTVTCHQRALRVLSTWPKLGTRYFTTDDPILAIKTDAPYGGHAVGRSQRPPIFIGRTNAPAYIYAGRQTSSVWTGRWNKAVKKCIRYRQLLGNLGFARTTPTIV